MNSSCQIIAISNAVKRKYSAFINPELIEVIYNGIPIGNCRQSAEKKRKGFINICMLGVITENKNHHDAFKALAYIKNNFKRDDLILNIAGTGDDSYIDSLKRFAADNGIKDNVKFLGYMKDIRPLLAEMDIGIVCSKKEAFGRISVEFMLNFMPVIASDWGANPEIVLDNKTGYLYPLGDYRKMAERLLDLIENKKNMNQFIDAGHRRAVECFDSRYNSKKIFNLYRKVLNR